MPDKKLTGKNTAFRLNMSPLPGYHERLRTDENSIRRALWLHKYISDSVLRHDLPASHGKVLLFTDRIATAVSSRPVPETSLLGRTQSPQWNVHQLSGMT